ncbi:MAG TPA: acyltransferase [bacterium]|nr:acyltransferase [bacterium]
MIQTDSDGYSLGGHILISEWVIISDGVILAAYGGSIEIGAHAYVGPYCVLYGHGGLAIGRDTMIGAHTVVIPANHGFARIDVPMSAQPLTQEGIEIGEDVWIGSGCRVLDGVRIGRGAVIGAGSVVTQDVESYGVAYGVPARVAWNRAAAVRARDAGAATGGASSP